MRFSEVGMRSVFEKNVNCCEMWHHTFREFEQKQALCATCFFRFVSRFFVFSLRSVFESKGEYESSARMSILKKMRLKGLQDSNCISSARVQALADSTHSNCSKCEVRAGSVKNHVKSVEDTPELHESRYEIFAKCSRFLAK